MKKNREKKLFPLFTDLTKKKAVVFGAGTIATRRVKTLLSFAGEIHVIAPEASAEILALAEKGEIVYQEKSYEREDLYDADLVLAATDDGKINEDIYSACKCLGILVNVASDQKKCDFHFNMKNLSPKTLHKFLEITRLENAEIKIQYQAV